MLLPLLCQFPPHPLPDVDRQINVVSMVGSSKGAAEFDGVIHEFLPGAGILGCEAMSHKSVHKPVLSQGVEVRLLAVAMATETQKG